MLEDTDEYEPIVQSFTLQISGNEDFRINTYTRYMKMAMYCNFVQMWQFLASYYMDVDPKLN